MNHPETESAWRGKRVLVTGAGGFIGSHLTERLVQMGADVTAFVRYNSRADLGALRWVDKQVVAAAQLVWGDIRDPQAMLKATRGQHVVFHLAALIAIPYSYVHPDEVVSTNVLGTQNVLSAGLAAGVERVVHTSTSEVYGTARYAPIDEHHPLQGQSPYAASKIGADKLAESYHLSFGLPVVTVRPFNTFGPRQSARAVIPTIITQAVTLAEIRLGNLAPTRDFTYVKDTVSGFLALAASDQCIGHEINLGTGREISIGQLAERILQQTASRAQLTQDEQRIRPASSEVERLISDNRLAQQLAGWAPRYSLDEGLRETIAWIRQHTDVYRPDVYQI